MTLLSQSNFKIVHARRRSRSDQFPGMGEQAKQFLEWED